MTATWLTAASFAIGILLAARSESVPVTVGLIFLACSLLTMRSASIRLIAIVIAAAGAGWLICSAQLGVARPVAHLARSYPRCELEGTISQRAAIGTFVVLRSVVCPQGAAEGAEVVMEVRGELGSTVWARGWLMPLGSSGMDAARSRAGAAATFHVTTAEVTAPRSMPHRAAVGVRRALRRATADRPPATGGLLRGLAIGETDLMPARHQDTLRRAGLSHLVAVSGTNVTIVLSAVAALAGRLSRRMKLCASLAALTLFVAIVGPEPSVLRAAAMGAVGLVAVLAGTRSRPLNALALGVIAVLALRPAMVHALGLHLSVAATAGICAWAVPIERRIRLGPRWLRVAAAVTASAQLAVSPLLVWTFGEFPVLGLPANVLAAPAVAPATVLALGAGIVGLVWRGGARALTAIAAPFADWILAVGQAFGDRETAVLRVPRSLGWVLAAGVVVVVLSRARAGRARRPDPASSLTSGTVR